MDREKLNKAAIIAAANYDNPFDEPAYDKKFYDGFIASADWLMQQPLSERLTDEEKEKILKLYNKVQDSNYDGTIEGVIKSSVSAVVMMCLVEIFGIDLFKEK